MREMRVNTINWHCYINRPAKREKPKRAPQQTRATKNETKESVYRTHQKQIIVVRQ